MSRSELISYIESTQEAGRQYVQRVLTGPVVMLNLLKFRDFANYSTHPELAPAMPISGAEAFDRYVQHTLLYLRESGAMSCFSARVGHS